jgi:DM4/DM12 family
VALALPIDIPDYNTFVSFNLEANYALPTRSTDFTQGLYDKILFIDGADDGEQEVAEEEEFEERELETVDFFSRRNVYRMIEGKMDSYGIKGRECLLRLICEVTGSDLIEMNGVLGNLFHVLMT